MANAALVAALRKLADQLETEDSRPSASEKIRAGAQGSIIPEDYKGQKVALKVFDYTGRPDVAKAIIDFEREYHSLKSLSHPSIIRFIDFEHVPATNIAFLRMEWASTMLSDSGLAVDLGDIICHHDGQHSQRPKSYIAEEFVWHVLFHLGTALALCHYGIELLRESQTEHIDCAEVLSKLFRRPPVELQQLSAEHRRVTCTTERMWFSLRPSHEPIIHRDIKPRNVLLSDPTMKTNDEGWRTNVTLDATNRLRIQPIILLGDFGLSTPLRNAKTVGIGSYGFTAPEVPQAPSRPDSDGFEWTTSCDIFSLGATVWNLMTLQSPPELFTSSSCFGDLPCCFSRPLQDLVRKCLSIRPSDRPTALHIVTACINRACWNDTYVSPYGVLTGSYFHSRLVRSWNRVLGRLNPASMPLAEECQLPSIFDDTVEFQGLAALGKQRPRAIFIEGAYRANHFNRRQHFDLPMQRYPYFTGRQVILQNLFDYFESRDHPQIIMALAGLGGVGKTQIAAEFAFQLREYDPDVAVYWVEGETPGQIQASYHRIATSLGLTNSSQSNTDFVHLVKMWLESNESRRWLMIIDNADFVDSITRLVPTFSKGALLFTTRNQRLIQDRASNLRVLEIPTFTEDEGTDLLMTLLGKDKGGDRATAQIVKRLGALPLALSHVAGLTRSLRISLSEVLELYSRGESMILQQKVDLPSRHRQYPESLASVLTLSFNKLPASAIDVLSLISFLDPDNIPISLLAGEFEDKLTLLTAIQALQKTSLIQSIRNTTDAEEQRYCVHRLVQTLAKDQLDEQLVQKFATSALKIVAKNFPDNPFDEWQTCAELLPHAERVLQISTDGLTQEAQLIRVELLEKSSTYLVELGMLNSAKQGSRDAIKARHTLQGEGHPAVLRSSQKLARVLVSNGEYEEAIGLLKSLLLATKDGIPLRKVDVEIHADALGALAVAYQDTGKYAEALELIDQEMRTREISNDPKSVMVLSTRENLALVLDKLGRFQEAELEHGAAFQGLKELLGSDHPRTWVCLSNLAISLQNQEKYTEAIAFQNEAVASLTRLLGTRNPSTLRSSLRLAYVLGNRHRSPGDTSGLGESITLYQECLETLSAVYGRKHPETIECKAGLSSIYFRLGKFEDAENTIKEALEDYEMVLGPQHPSTLAAMKTLAEQLQQQGKLEPAEVLLRDVLAFRKQILGVDHPDTVDSASDLASVLTDQGRTNEATKIVIDYTTPSDSQKRSTQGLPKPRVDDILGALIGKGSTERVQPATLSSSPSTTRENSAREVVTINDAVVFFDRKPRTRDRAELLDHHVLELVGRRHHIFVLDDSPSMKTFQNEASRLLRTLTEFCKSKDDVMDLYIGESHHGRFTSSSKVVKRFESTTSYSNPTEGSWIHAMDSILQKSKEYIVLEKPRSRRFFAFGPAGYKWNTKPLTIYILLAGISDETLNRFVEFRGILQHISKENGLGRNTIAIQFIQFGDDEGTKKHLQCLDDSLMDRGYFDIVDQEPASGSVWKMLVGSLTTALDDDADDEPPF